MKNKLIRQIFTACMITFLLSYGLLMMVLTEYFARQNMEELEERAIYITALIEEKGWDFIGHISDSGTRITIISPDGTVLFDSRLDAAELGSHADREEFQEALRTGTGTSERYSESFLRKTANYAVKLESGEVVRISMQQDSVWMLLVRMLNPLGFAVLVIVFLSVVIAVRLSQNMMEPINRLDVENPDDRDVYDEMKPFIRRIVSQNQQIHRQMYALQEEHKKQDAMRREFTANVSHELKTPLTSISGFAEIIRDGFVQQKDIPHFADTIYQEAQRLMVLVNDILKLSKLEEEGSHTSHERMRVSLAELCRQVTERLQIHAAKAGITLQCDGTEAEIWGVPEVLEEIVYNVCDNAIKYNRSGGYVHVTTGMEEGEAFVRVEDNGIGIPEADQSRVFERFYRVNKSHSKEVGGTGLGLSIVKHGMAYHNARIALKSTEGVGTVMTLYFPSA